MDKQVNESTSASFIREKKLTTGHAYWAVVAQHMCTQSNGAWKFTGKQCAARMNVCKDIFRIIRDLSRTSGQVRLKTRNINYIELPGVELGEMEELRELVRKHLPIFRLMETFSFQTDSEKAPEFLFSTDDPESFVTALKTAAFAKRRRQDDDWVEEEAGKAGSDVEEDEDSAARRAKLEEAMAKKKQTQEGNRASKKANMFETHMKTALEQSNKAYDNLQSAFKLANDERTAAYSQMMDRLEQSEVRMRKEQELRALETKQIAALEAERAQKHEERQRARDAQADKVTNIIIGLLAKE